MFGHDIDSQVCRFSGQLASALNFKTINPPKFAANATAYRNANTTKIVKYVDHYENVTVLAYYS